jgi:tRNA(Ile)-lysidine synthase
MHLLAGWARAEKKPAPVVLSVDHGLRKSSAADTKKVAAWAKAAGLKAHLLTWRGAKPKSGVEAAAREARYRLMGAWLVKHKIAALFAGHTQDDQAETFLLRLARGSGLDGLAAMQATAPWPVPGFESLVLRRPLLSFSRADLRAHLAALGQPWLDDPMNGDPAFDRVKLRQARAALEAVGLTVPRIAAAAAHLSRARAALEVMTEAVLERAAYPLGRGYVLDPAVLAAAPREVAYRALARLLMQVSGQAYRPRFDSLERLYGRIAAGTCCQGVTLHGCHIRPASRNRRTKATHLLLVEPEKPRKTAASPGKRPLRG